jgi:hypothetical protein
VLKEIRDERVEMEWEDRIIVMANGEFCRNSEIGNVIDWEDGLGFVASYQSHLAHCMLVCVPGC